MVTGHSTEAARVSGYLALTFAILQIVAAGVGAAVGGAVTAAAYVAVVNGGLALALYVQARRVAAP